MKESIWSFLWGARFMLGIMLIVGLVIILYHQVLMLLYGKDKFVEKDILKHNLCTTSLGFNYCSWWAISHFVFYAILGFLFPKYWVLLIIIGILFEGFEYLWGRYYEGKSNVRFFNNKEIDAPYFFFNIRDIIANILGLTFGILLFKALYPQCNINNCNDTFCIFPK